MKRADLYFALVVAAFFVPFFLSRTLYEGYQSFNAAHGMVMSFVKFSSAYSYQCNASFQKI